MTTIIPPASRRVLNVQPQGEGCKLCGRRHHADARHVKAGYQPKKSQRFSGTHTKGWGSTPPVPWQGKLPTFSFLATCRRRRLSDDFNGRELHTQYAGSRRVADPAAPPVVLDAANKAQDAESLTAARYTILRHGDA